MGKGFRYQPNWSPDSKKIAFVDEMVNIHVHNLETGLTSRIDQAQWQNHFGLQNFSLNWSPDSRYLTYTKTINGRADAVFIHDGQTGVVTQVTSGYYNDNNPVFDVDGKYLYFMSDRALRPVYSDLDWAFVYPNSTQIVAVTLTKDGKSPLYPRNDEV